MSVIKQKVILVVTLGAFTILAYFFYAPEFSQKKAFQFNRKKLANTLGQRSLYARSSLDLIKLKVDNRQLVANTTLNTNLQKKIEDVYARYQPDYAAFVAIEPSTGKVLILTDYSKGGHRGNLALRSSFPAASVFKVVTSAAAIEEGGLYPDSRIPFTGSTTSLYKRNLTYKTNRWTRFVSLEKALAKSINSVFGKIAAHGLGQSTLQKYADAFHFNTKIQFDMNAEPGNAEIPEDLFGIAESGSGYTRRQTMSPLQGALIAATIVNDGKMPAPYLITNVLNRHGEEVYSYQTKPAEEVINEDTAILLKKMMEKTIITGTARKHYRDYQKNRILSKLFIGGKTGSLSGLNPKGKYDWFVGFAENRTNKNQKIAFASMIINGKYWRVKSAYVARQFILSYFKEQLTSDPTNTAFQWIDIRSSHTHANAIASTNSP